LIDGKIPSIVSFPNSFEVTTSTLIEKTMTKCCNYNPIASQQWQANLKSPHKFVMFFLAIKTDINHERNNKVKINNLKATRELGVITKEEFKIKGYDNSYHVIKSPHVSHV
jgi:hypothetical protein